jgi:AcrR family transcriptional regulator
MDARQARRRTGPGTRVRRYRQDLRARQTQENRDRIVIAAIALIKTARRLTDITLDEVARQARLTVRTVLRQFGSRDGVFEAALEQLTIELSELRRPSPPGDVDAAIVSLLNQYEKVGDLNMRALEVEDQLPLVHGTLETARAFHRVWLRTVFGPQLAPLADVERERRITALYAATDSYLWKLMRRDLRLTESETRDVFRRLVRGVLQ